MVRLDSHAKHGAARVGSLALVLLLSSGLGLLSGCRTARAKKALPYVLEIEERNRHLEEQFRSGNLLGVADVYADDALLIDARGKSVTGRQEIDEYWSAIEEPVDWRIEIRRVFGSDTLAYELGRSHLTTASQDGTQIASADFLLLWRREKTGEWKIALDAYWPIAKP